MLIPIADIPKRHVSKMVKAATKHLTRNWDARFLNVRYLDIGSPGCKAEVSLSGVSERYGKELAKKILATYNQHPALQKEAAKKKEEEETAKRKEAFNGLGKSLLGRELAKEAAERYSITNFLHRACIGSRG